MAFVTAAAAIGSSILASVGASTLAGIYVISAAVGFLSQAALGIALNALAPKPKLSGGTRGYNVTQRGSVVSHQVLYGEVKAAGAIVYDGSTGTNNKYLHRVLAMAGHEVESFERVWINDSYIDVTDIDVDGNIPTVVDPDGTTSNRYDGKLRINFHLGSEDQVADSDLVSEVPEWTSNHRLRNIAYMYCRLSFDQDAYPNGVPEIQATIKGKKVYDPRTDTTVWSSNPALCLRDYLTSPYGLSEASANIDDTLVTTAANVCDETNTLASTKRYTCNGSFTTDVTPYELLSNILTSMGGLLWYAQGEWRMKPAYWVAPTTSLNEDDFRSTISVNTRHSRRDNFNVVRGTFRGEESNWQTTDYPDVTNSAYLTADGGQESVADIDLPFTDTSIEARRIGRIALERNRQQLTVQANFGLKAFSLQVGDNVKLSVSRFGWVNKEFEVVAWTFGIVEGLDLQVSLTLRETAEGIFDEIDDGVAYERDNTTLPSPFEVPPVGISVQALAQVSNQKVSNIAVATITSGRPESVDYVDIEYKLSSESTYSSFGQGPLGEFRVRDLNVDFYDFRVRAVNSFGVKGDFEYLFDVEVNAFLGDPSDVSSLGVELSGGTLFLSWPPLVDADLSHYEVKLNTNTTGATWGNSTTVIEKIARPATSASLPARSGTFLIRAYDKEGNFSVNPTSVVVLPGELPQLGQTDTQTEDPTFSGTLSNTVVDSSALLIDDTSAANPTGEYLFSNYIDTSSTRQARVTGFRTFSRVYDDTTLLWDDIPGNWDTWPDNWDTWTDEDANFGDVGVTIYVSATQDDPAGTPTWGDYVLANGGSILGRAFRFKAVLTSTSTKFTPSITALSATVEY